MIVGHCTPGQFPDLFLGIQVGRSDRQPHDFQTRVSRQQFTDRLALMPPGPIPQQRDRTIRVSIEQLLQMACGRLGIETFRTQHPFLTRLQIQRAIEAHFAPSRVHANNRRLSAWRPGLHRGGLQVHPGFILAQKDRVRRILQHVDQFFSSCASKSATWCSRRDLKTFSVR